MIVYAGFAERGRSLKMVLGYHIIFSAYGFWLPNDPRGSWSEFVGAWELFLAGGKATKTTESRSLAYDPHDRSKRLAVKRELARPPVKFTGLQARAIGHGFRDYVARSGLPVWACAIMPDHVHLVVGPFRLSVEQIVIQLKGEATAALLDERLHPFADLANPAELPPKCWARGEWKVFLNDNERIASAVQYVENNPVKAGLPQQRWSFVTPYKPHAV
ncbi:MAG: transposase [Planctomycetes bacterium]|nr:transposase [Planctomycetota bacterium]